ncbi:MAG TPA: 30S ribosomal protein S20 [Candidatus Bathyarchaeia archaeon]|nr:30S ribosomal protein S20 [Candidatus Bathyarchaeia archaeon]
MPITKSAKKALRRDRRKKLKNLLIRNKLKKVLKSTLKQPNLSIQADASRIIDRAAKKGVIHKNKAARLKSRLTKLINKASLAKKSPPKRKKKTG